MRLNALFLSICFVCAGSLPSRAQVTLNPFPSREIGHAQFNPISPAPTTLSPNLVEGRELYGPLAVAVDVNASPLPLIYVADNGNNRILVWQYKPSLGDPSQEASFPVADQVIGENDMYTTINLGPPANSTAVILPTGLIVDSKGNLYVADSGNNRILRFPRGSQLPDMVLGQPSINNRAANQNLPTPTEKTLNFGNGAAVVGMVFDSAGNLFVSDTGNNRVLRFAKADLDSGVNDPAANLVLGQNTFTSADPLTSLTGSNNLPTHTGFVLPTALAMDSKGRLYVADTPVANGIGRVLVFPANLTGNNTPALRVIGLVIGSSTATQDRDNHTRVIGPSGIFLLANDSVGVVDARLSRILIFPPCANPSSSGSVCDSTSWPETPGTQQNPGQISPLATTVLGQNDFSVVNAKPNGGQPQPGTNTFAAPFFATLTAKNELFLADSGNNRVLVMPVSGNTVGAATRVLGQDQFSYNAANLIEGREFDFLASLGNGQLTADSGIAIDTNSTPPHLYVADTYNNRILGFNDVRTLKAGGKADLVIGQPDMLHSLINYPSNDPNKPDANTLYSPTGLALDSAGNLWVADSGNHRVLRFPAPFAQQATQESADLVLGQGSATAFKSNTIAPSTMARPYGLAFDSAGGQDFRLVVSDPSYNRVLIYTNQNGTWSQTPTTVLGQGNFTSIGNGTGLNQMRSPFHVAVDTSGHVYVADAGNNRVLIFGPAALANNGDSALNASIVSGLSNPNGVFVNSHTGEIWVADTSNSRLVRYQAFDQLLLGNTQPQTVIGEAAQPIAVSQDQFGDLYVADASNRMVVHYQGLLAVNGANFLLQSPASRGVPTALAPGMLASICPPLRTIAQACLPDDPQQFGGQTANFSDLPNPIPLPTTLGNMQVTVNGNPAPLYFVSPRQINFQIPWATQAGQVLVEVVDTTSGQVLGSYPVQITAFSPGLFYNYNLPTKADNLAAQPRPGITYQVAATNQDGSVNSPSNCASRGTTVTLYGTGQGYLPGAPADGDLSPSGVTTPGGFRVVINPASGFVPDANLLYSGLAPGEVGVWQLNVTIPMTVPPGNDEVFVLDPNNNSSLDPQQLVTTLCVKQ